MNHLSSGPRRINWRVVNTMQNQPLDLGLIAKMNGVVAAHCKVLFRPVPHYDPADWPENEVFLLEIERDFKFGKGKSLVALADGGKNKVGHDVKYVRWYNLYGEDADNSKNKLKISDKTFTYGVAKARDLWNEKIKEGYNRVK